MAKQASADKKIAALPESLLEGADPGRVAAALAQALSGDRTPVENYKRAIEHLTQGEGVIETAGEAFDVNEGSVLLLLTYLSAMEMPTDQVSAGTDRLAHILIGMHIMGWRQRPGGVGTVGWPD